MYVCMDAGKWLEAMYLIGVFLDREEDVGEL